MPRAMLCIWNIPDELKFFDVHVERADIPILKLANNKFLGGSNLTPKEEKAVASVLAALDKHKQNWRGSVLYHGWLQRTWFKHELNREQVNVLRGSFAVITTGCFM